METSDPDPASALDAPGAATLRFPCAGCGAALAWDPDADALVCSHCDARVEVPRSDATIVERTFAEAGAAARGLGLARRTARCRRCGASTSIDEVATALACAFCGDAQVLEGSENRNALRPESLVPLDVGRARVEREFQAWLGRLWFRPSALRRARIDEAVGVYVPFWSFDASVRSRWAAESGTYYQVPEAYTAIVQGRRIVRTRMVTKVRWWPSCGERADRWDDLLVHASRGLSPELARELGAWDTGALVPYRPEYLAGWRAEEYAIDLEQGWADGLARIEAGQRARCAGDVPGDTHRALRVENEVGDRRWKLVLLPLWSLTYRWRGETYAVLVHGQSGRVVGCAPISWAKVAALCAAVAAAVLAALAFAAAAGLLH